MSTLSLFETNDGPVRPNEMRLAKLEGPRGREQDENAASHARSVCAGCLHDQERRKIAGAEAGDMPNATAAMANPVKAMETQTAKAISDDPGRSCVAMGGYETVGDNSVMLSPNRFLEYDYAAGQGS
jgi:hypothetical protein